MHGNYLYNHTCKMEKAIKFCKGRYKWLSFFSSFFSFSPLLLVEVVIEGDSWKCYDVCVSTEVATCLVSHYLFLFP